MEQILYRTYALEKSHFRTKLSLAACITFLSLNIVCIGFPILREKINSLKEFRVVTMEPFSVQLMEAIAQKCSKTMLGKNWMNVLGHIHTKM